MTRDKDWRGFTLIELMIVIAIIAILAAILIPNFQHARAESLTAACEDNQKGIATAMEEYAVDNAGAYTKTLPAIYLPSLPTDPANGGTYTITVPAASDPTFGYYKIVDAGGHDPTTTTRLFKSGGGQCTTCSGVAYFQSQGLIGY